MATTTPNYDVNLEDERFQQVNTEKENALTDVKNTYDGMINQSDDFYNAQIQASKDWADQQQQIQQEQTDFTIEQIEQQKEQAEKDYKKEQSGAYVDWQKQSNNYGVNAEQMAASGLSTTGYAESSRVGMYNTYQNRVAVAKESHDKAWMNFDNEINAARLQNNAAQAEIALQAYKEKCALLLEGFQYKNSLMLELQNQLQETEDRYYSRWQDVYNQIVQENAMKEDIRRYEEQKEYKEEQDKLAQENWEKEYELMLQQDDATSGYLENENELATSEEKAFGQTALPIMGNPNLFPISAAKSAMKHDGLTTGKFSPNSKVDERSNSSSASNSGNATNASPQTILEITNYIAKNNLSSTKAADYLASLVNKGKITEAEAQTYYNNISKIKGW